MEPNSVPVEVVSDTGALPNTSSTGTQETKTEPASDTVIQEPKVTETPAKEKEQDRFAPKFAALSRKEKTLRDTEKTLKQKEAEVQAREKALIEREAQVKARNQLKKEKPLQYLEEEGLTYDEITQAVLNNGEIPAEKKQEHIIAALQSEVSKLNSKLEEREKKELDAKEEQERQSAEQKYSERIEGFKTEIKTFVDGSGEETYELLKSGLFNQATNPVEAIYDVILEHYETTKAKSSEGVGEVLDVKQAADLLEQWLEKESEKIAKTKKFKSKLPPPAEPKVEPKLEEVQSQSTKTLENAHSSTVPNRQETKLTDEERIAKAANLIRYSKT